MKKITTIFKIMLLAVVVLVMAQGCIPTTPVGGNPTPVDSTKGSLKVTVMSFVNVLTPPSVLTGTFTFEFYKAATNALVATTIETYLVPLEAKTYSSIDAGSYYIRVKYNGNYIQLVGAMGVHANQTDAFDINASQETTQNLLLDLN